MSRLMGIIVTAVVSLACSANAQEQLGPLQGCPMKGAEPKCMFIKAQDGQTYDISLATKKPKPNYLIIAVKGTKSTLDLHADGMPKITT
jgi:hypothetical protein